MLIRKPTASSPQSVTFKHGDQLIQKLSDRRGDILHLTTMASACQASQVNQSVANYAAVLVGDVTGLAHLSICPFVVYGS